MSDPLECVKSQLAVLPEFPTTMQVVQAFTEVRRVLPALIAELEMLRVDAARFWGREG